MAYPFKKNVTRIFFQKLMSAETVFFLLPALMAILVAGTVAQRWIGLYGAQEMFFGSFILWVGPLPLPSGYTLMAILSIALALKFLFKSPWRVKRSGIILTHLGVLILMTGGLMTSLFARESYMRIVEGGQSSTLYDYQRKSLVIFEDGRALARVPFARLENTPWPDLPFTLTVVGWCENCQILKRTEVESTDEAVVYQGLARFMALQSRPPEKEPEGNLSGLTFMVDGLSKAQNGQYIAFDSNPMPVTLKKDGHVFEIRLGKDERALPFTVALKNFEKISYGGTQKAKAYFSDVVITDGPLVFPARIEMNKPLRYRGYTFFQSSFEKGEDSLQNTQATILAVVENKGRLFPYIGTCVMGVGLMLHLFWTLMKRWGK